MEKNKKKFGETKVGQFLGKVKDKLPELAGDVVDVIASPNPAGALVEKLIPKLKASKNPVSNELMMEFEMKKMEFEKELYALEVQDRDSARKREAEYVKAGKTDYMMVATGVSGLLSFLFCIYAVVYIPSVKENDLFIHLMGIIEGVVLGNIFAYYYGTSKSSKDKDDRALK
jgi:uncharacterized protein YqhQ